MKNTAAPPQVSLELPVLRCLVSKSPRSLADVRDWVSRNVDLSTDDHQMVKMPSGKELRLFERTIGNLLTTKRAGNLTARGYVERLVRDTYSVTDAGRLYLFNEETAIAELETCLEGVRLDP